MLPGYITGTFTKENTQIDLLKLCNFANSRLIIDRVIGLNLEKKYIALQNRPPIYFDTLSINTGGEPELSSMVGAKKYGVPIKPISNLIQVFENIKSKINNYKNINFVIIGGGAGGIEIALSVKNYLNNQNTLIEKQVTLISKSKDLIDGHSALAKLNATKFLIENDIKLITDNPVIEIGKNFVKTKKGTKIKSDFSVVVTSITATKWMSQSGRNLSDDGFIEVNNFLQSSNENIFASGDVCSIKGKNLVKSGVYAVRQGPILSKNLRAKILRAKYAVPPCCQMLSGFKKSGFEIFQRLRRGSGCDSTLADRIILQLSPSPIGRSLLQRGTGLRALVAAVALKGFNECATLHHIRNPW